MRSLVLLVVAACGSGSTAHLGMAPSDGGVDAAADAAADAAITYSISVGSPDVVATPVHSISVAITGAPNTDVMVTLDRATAGALPSAPLTLDASGAGTVMFTPCYALSANCLGPATLTLTDSTAAPLATTNVNLVASPIVGDVAPCQTTANVLYLVGNDNYLTGPWQSTPLASWWVGLSPDTVQFQLFDGGAAYDAEFSGFEVPRVLAPGIFEDARPYNAQIADHPALCIQHDGVGCSPTIGRFQIHEYAPDPQTGALGSTTISFEQLTNPSSPLPSIPPMIAGCVHYQHVLPSPATPPTPDPTKVSVQVFGFTASGTPNGLPDPTARAIFTATDGTVVLDTIVNAFGQAEASMPTGGTVTTIQFGSGEQIRSYRGVVNGNHFVISAGGPTTGVEDQMLMTAVAPANTALGIITSCGDVTHANPPDRPNPPVRSILHFYDGCRSSTFNMLTMAGPAAGGDPTQFLWQTNLPHVPYGNVDLAGTWTPYATGTVKLTNVVASYSLNVTWNTLIGPNRLNKGSLISAPVAGTNQVTLTYPPGVGDRTLIEADEVGGQQQRFFAYATPPSTVTIDFSAQPVPKISALQQTHTGATWTQTAGSADVRTVIWRAQAHGGPVTWTVTEPNDGLASTTLPAIPAAESAIDPTTDLSSNALASGIAILYDDYDVVSGYALFPPTTDYQQHRSHLELSGNHPFP